MPDETHPPFPPASTPYPGVYPPEGGDPIPGPEGDDPERPVLGPRTAPRGAGPFAWLAVVVALGVAIVWQNMPERYQRAALYLPPNVAAEPAPFEAADPVVMQAKINIQAGHEMEGLSPGSGAQFRDLRTLDTLAAGAVAPGDPPEPEHQIVIAITAGEWEGPDEALLRLLDAEDALDIYDAEEDASAETGRAARYYGQRERRRDALRADLPVLEQLYDRGSASLDDAQRERLESRYRYFGRLALTWDLDETDAERQAVMDSHALWRLLGLIVFLIVAAGAVLAGLVFIILGLVKLCDGRLHRRSRRPVVHGGALLETVAIFAALFALMVIGVTWLAEKNPVFAALQLPMQWVLILVPLWPLARGWTFAEWREAFGVHRGRGVFREIGAGVLAYLASVPFFLIGACITVLVTALNEILLGPTPYPESNTILDAIAGADALSLLLLASLTCIWAPVCEELVFRGAFFSHLWSRWHCLLVMLVTALGFAYMHSYGPLMLWPIIALGIMFAFMRWWRGSIIASVTAHFLHNATLTCVLIMLAGLFPT